MDSLATRRLVSRRPETPRDHDGHESWDFIEEPDKSVAKFSPASHPPDASPNTVNRPLNPLKSTVGLS